MGALHEPSRWPWPDQKDLGAAKAPGHDQQLDLNLLSLFGDSHEEPVARPPQGYTGDACMAAAAATRALSADAVGCFHASTPAGMGIALVSDPYQDSMRSPIGLPKQQQQQSECHCTSTLMTAAKALLGNTAVAGAYTDCGRSPSMRTVVRIKIPSADPSDLPPDALPRLQACLALQHPTCMITGAIIRQGCIELVLEYVEQVAVPDAPVSAGLGAAQELEQPPASAQQMGLSALELLVSELGARQADRVRTAPVMMQYGGAGAGGPPCSVHWSESHGAWLVDEAQPQRQSGSQPCIVAAPVCTLPSVVGSVLHLRVQGLSPGCRLTATMNGSDLGVTYSPSEPQPPGLQAGGETELVVAPSGPCCPGLMVLELWTPPPAVQPAEGAASGSGCQPASCVCSTAAVVVLPEVAASAAAELQRAWCSGTLRGCSKERTAFATDLGMWLRACGGAIVDAAEGSSGGGEVGGPWAADLEQHRSSMLEVVAPKLLRFAISHAWHDTVALLIGSMLKAGMPDASLSRMLASWAMQMQAASASMCLATMAAGTPSTGSPAAGNSGPIPSGQVATGSSSQPVASTHPGPSRLVHESAAAPVLPAAGLASLARASLLRFPQPGLEAKYASWLDHRNMPIGRASLWIMPAMMLAVAYQEWAMGSSPLVHLTLLTVALPSLLCAALVATVPRMSPYILCGHMNMLLIAWFGVTKLMQFKGLLAFPSSGLEFMKKGMDSVGEGVFFALWMQLRMRCHTPVWLFYGLCTAVHYVHIGLVENLAQGMLRSLPWVSFIIMLGWVIDVHNRRMFVAALARQQQEAIKQRGHKSFGT